MQSPHAVERRTGPEDAGESEVHELDVSIVSRLDLLSLHAPSPLRRVQPPNTPTQCSVLNLQCNTNKV